LARVYKSRSLLVKNKSTLISKITLSSNWLLSPSYMQTLD
jgi:hypothetical protein